MLAAIFATAASWAVLRFVLQADWQLPLLPLAAIILGALVATLALGLAGTRAALAERPARRLRNP